MSNNPYGSPENQQNPFAQGRYQQPPQNPYGQNQQSPYEQSPYGQQSPYGHPNPYQQNPYQQPQQNPFLSNQVQPYEQQSMPPALRGFAQMNMFNHVGSAIFPLISVVMFMIEKDKNKVYDKHLRETMNMGLTRLALGVAAGFASGWLASLLGILSFVYFVLAVMGAVEGIKAFKEGRGVEYKGAIPFTRPDN